MYFDRQTTAALSKILHDFIGSYAEEKKNSLGSFGKNLIQYKQSMCLTLFHFLSRPHISDSGTCVLSVKDLSLGMAFYVDG